MFDLKTTSKKRVKGLVQIEGPHGRTYTIENKELKRRVHPQQ
jgi:hypothetical protein